MNLYLPSNTPNRLTDGLMAIRYLFGFRGEALTAGALANGATRSTAEEIEEYLDELVGN